MDAVGPPLGEIAWPLAWSPSGPARSIPSRTASADPPTHVSQKTADIPPLLADARRFKSLVFDVDGTLYRHAPVKRGMVTRLIKSHLLNPARGVRVVRGLQAFRKAQEALRGSEPTPRLAEAQLELASKQSGASIEAIRGWVEQWMETAPLDLISQSVWPGLLDFLRRAKERGITMGVVSDYPAGVKLEALSMEHFFGPVISAQDADVGAFKPNPAGLLRAIERLERDPSEVLYIGDRAEVDAAAARAAGCACVLVGQGEAVVSRESWVEVPDFWELRSILF